MFLYFSLCFYPTTNDYNRLILALLFLVFFSVFYTTPLYIAFPMHIFVIFRFIFSLCFIFIHFLYFRIALQAFVRMRLTNIIVFSYCFYFCFYFFIYLQEYSRTLCFYNTYRVLQFMVLACF